VSVAHVISGLATESVGLCNAMGGRGEPVVKLIGTAFEAQLVGMNRSNPFGIRSHPHSFWPDNWWVNFQTSS
jgi:hypothetical protein